jgi:hypothetical protein
MLKQLRDQTAHFALAFAVVALAHGFGVVLTLSGSIVIALAPGVAREVTEWTSATKARKALGLRGSSLIPRSVPWSRGSLLDLVGWLAGGVAAGLLWS